MFNYQLSRSHERHPVAQWPTDQSGEETRAIPDAQRRSTAGDLLADVPSSVTGGYHGTFFPRTTRVTILLHFGSEHFQTNVVQPCESRSTTSSENPPLTSVSLGGAYVSATSARS